MTVRTLTEDTRNPALLFAGTEFGMYWSFDGGKHWRFPGGSLPRVMVDCILVDERTNDLILGTYGRGVIILDDIRALEAERSPAPGIVRVFPMRAATEVYRWRDQPFEGGRPYTAPNSPVGALITYSLGDSRAGDSATAAHIVVRAHDGAVVRELAGPGAPGMHRVLWDLHTEFPFVPTAADSGYYGAPAAPYVAPGVYTVTISARGTTASETVQVRTDSSALTNLSGLAARERMMMQIDSLSRAFHDGKLALAAIDTEFTHVRALLAQSAKVPATDSAVTRVEKELRTVHESFSEEYGTPIGNAFDLLGGLEGSSAAPTEAEQRTLDLSTAQLRGTFAKLNELITTEMPRLRETLARQAPRAIAPVRAP
jgi:hypothetical protein